MPRYSLLIQRFPYGGREDSECVDWLMETYHKAKLDPRFHTVKAPRLNDTPITMTRNAALLAAQKHGYDFVLMVDSDMAPDCELGEDQTAKPFFDVAVNELLGREKPAVIAAPYVGPPPRENVYVFQWANRGNTLHPTAANPHLDQYGREQARIMAGVQPCGALPTGLMLVDMRALAKLPHPWTYYEYHNTGDECPACRQKKRGPEAQKASTEDVTFTRDLGLLGVDILCAWDSWAGHNKRYTARKPRPYTTDIVSHKMRDAIGSRIFSDDQQVLVEPPDWLAEHEANLSKFTAGFNSAVRKIDSEAFLRPERGSHIIGQTGVVLSPEPIPPGVASATPPVEPGTFLRPGYGGYAISGSTAQPTADVPVQPWAQHIPPAVGGPLTPADLLSGVPLG